MFAMFDVACIVRRKHADYKEEPNSPAPGDAKGRGGRVRSADRKQTSKPSAGGTGSARGTGSAQGHKAVRGGNKAAPSAAKHVKREPSPEPQRPVEPTDPVITDLPPGQLHQIMGLLVADEMMAARDTALETLKKQRHDEYVASLAVYDSKMEQRRIAEEHRIEEQRRMEEEARERKLGDEQAKQRLERQRNPQ